MRFGKTILGSFLLLAAILLPSVSFAHESRSPSAVAVAVETRWSSKIMSTLS